MAKSAGQAPVEKARRKIKRNPELEAPLLEMWDEVLAVAEAYFKALRPAPKSFEAHHLLESARERFLAGFVEHGLDPRIKAPALALFGTKDAGTAECPNSARLKRKEGEK